MVQVHPARSIVPQGGSHSLRCQVSGSPPHYFYWSREDGRPVPGSTQQRHQGTHSPKPLSPVSSPCWEGRHRPIHWDPILTHRATWGKGCICTDKLPSSSHQALSSTSPASSPQMPASTSAPVVTSITPIPAGPSCWSLVSPCACTSPRPSVLGWTVDTGGEHVPLLEGVVVLRQGCRPQRWRDNGAEASFRGRFSRTWLSSPREKERLG